MRDAAGIPVPPQEITERLTRMDPALGLRYLSAEWAVIWRWPADDPRWATVQSGETDPAFAFDIVGWLPITCSVDEAPAWLERTLRQYPKESVRKLCDRIAVWNTVDAPAAMIEDVITATRDEMGKHDEITSAIFSVTPTPTVAAQQDAKAAAKKAERKQTKRRPKATVPSADGGSAP